MSRIGKMPIKIPAGVTVEYKNNIFTVKGPKGTLTQEVNGNIDYKVENGEIFLTAKDDEQETNAKHGLYRALFASMIKGVEEGYQKGLEIKGVGWKVAKNGNGLTLNVGFSHPVTIEAVKGVTLETPSITEITVSGIDKCLVGQVAANIRAVREPEPYHGYGIRYKGEFVEHKEGKTSGGKGKK